MQFSDNVFSTRDRDSSGREIETTAEFKLNTTQVSSLDKEMQSGGKGKQRATRQNFWKNLQPSDKMSLIILNNNFRGEKTDFDPQQTTNMRLIIADQFDTTDGPIHSLLLRLELDESA